MLFWICYIIPFFAKYVHYDTVPEKLQAEKRVAANYDER